MIMKQTEGSSNRTRKRPSLLLLLIIISPLVLSLQGCMTPIVVDADEVALKLNTLTGTTTAYTTSGTYFQKWYIEKFYKINRSEQNLEMTANVNRGDAYGKDDIRVKTFDGSDVNVDVSFTYKIDVAKIIEVIRYTGRDGNIKNKWIRPYARCRIREELGRLSTEQFYDSRQRQKHAVMTKDRLNEDLKEHGIIVTNVNIQDFRFYKKYEEKIKQKKTADQSVEQQKSAKRAAIEDQKMHKVSTEKRVEVRVANYKGTLKKALLLAKGKSEQKVLQAKAYSYDLKKRADASFYKAKNTAQQIIELGKAEAEGLTKRVEALSGDGGINLLKLEYAKRLNSVRLSGEPWVISPEISALRVKEFSNLNEQATASRRKLKVVPSSSGRGARQ